MIQIQNYINGQLQAPVSGDYFQSLNPATALPIAQIPDSDSRDVALATAAAQAAFPEWAAMAPGYRQPVLIKIAQLIEKNLEKLALAESEDNGKPLSLARMLDIPRALLNFKFYASASLQFASESHANGSSEINYTLRQPVGVAGCISPWNLPLYLFTWKIAPALAAGCTVVAKPSEVTPLTAYLLSEICIEAGLPAGVLNIVHGYGHKVGQAISEHPGIKAVSFTGGTATGAAIARTAAPMFKKLSLELGGKNPNIIFADCNYEKMLATTLRSSFANQGQICLCGSRIYVERPLYERFKRDFVEQTRALVVGDPLDERSNLGAVVSESHYNKILSYIDLAQNEGGTVLCGGQPVKLTGRCANGWFIAPTIIEGLNETCRTNQEEIFGPVVTLQPFDTEEEALALANATEYGLAATLWTENLSRTHRMAAALHTGILWVNCWLHRDLRTPFGGVKNSGVGREGGFEALKFFTEPKNVCISF